LTTKCCGIHLLFKDVGAGYRLSNGKLGDLKRNRCGTQHTSKHTFQLLTLTLQLLSLNHYHRCQQFKSKLHLCNRVANRMRAIPSSNNPRSSAISDNYSSAHRQIQRTHCLIVSFPLPPSNPPKCPAYARAQSLTLIFLELEYQ
jgi:hypothetical protein